MKTLKAFLIVIFIAITCTIIYGGGIKIDAVKTLYEVESVTIGKSFGGYIVSVKTTEGKRFHMSKREFQKKVMMPGDRFYGTVSYKINFNLPLL